MSMGEQQNAKVKQNRLRRMADRQALDLRKSRRRDPYALDYETYFLVPRSDPNTSFGPFHGLDAVEEWLKSDPSRRATQWAVR
jgi:hypothetical protein